MGSNTDSHTGTVMPQCYTSYLCYDWPDLPGPKLGSRQTLAFTLAGLFLAPGLRLPETCSPESPQGVLLLVWAPALGQRGSHLKMPSVDLFCISGATHLLGAFPISPRALEQLPPLHLRSFWKRSEAVQHEYIQMPPSCPRVNNHLKPFLLFFML